MNIRKIRSNCNSLKVIEIDGPVRFFIKNDGKIEGMELGPFYNLTRRQTALLNQVLDALEEFFVDKVEELEKTSIATPIPAPFIKEFDGE